MLTQDVIELIESNAPAAPAGAARLRVQGGVLQFSEDGGSWVNVGSGSGTGTVTSVAATAGGLLVIGGTPTVAPTVGIAAMADKTIIGNGSGGSAVPVALITSTATGLIMDATTLKNSFRVGVSGGQSVVGDTVTTGNLTLRPNAADTTTGRVIAQGLGLQLPDGTAAVPSLRMTSDATGLYWDNTPALGFSVTGVRQMTVDGTGNVTAYGALSRFELHDVGGTFTYGAIRVNAGGNFSIWSGTGGSAANQFLEALPGTELHFLQLTGVTWKSGAALTATAPTVMEFAITPPSIASGASIKLDAYKYSAVTVTLTGGTHVTTAAGFNFIDIEAPTYTDASAVTVDNGATLTIKGAPIAAGSVTLTNAYALWIQGDQTRFDGQMNTHNVVPTASTTYNLGSSSLVWSAGWITTLAATTLIDLTSVGPKITLGASVSSLDRNGGTWQLVSGGVAALTYDASSLTLGTAATLTINGTLAGGTNSLVANGSVATALTAVGPTGSHTTVQEWLLVKGTGGVSRWIPMF